MNLVCKEEQLNSPVVPSGFGREHVFVLPSIGIASESRKIIIRFIDEIIRLYENRIGEHIHIPVESELLYLRIISSVYALDDLAIFVTHGSTFAEHSYRVLRIIVEISGSQYVMIFVLQLDKSTSELGKIFINQICKLIACEDCLILKNADISPCINETGIHIP